MLWTFFAIVFVKFIMEILDKVGTKEYIRTCETFNNFNNTERV